MIPIETPFTNDTLMEWARGETANARPSAVGPVIDNVLSRIGEFVGWPERAQLLLEGCDRSKAYHSFPSELITVARQQRIRLDTRSNGPAVSAFLLAGGVRPGRFASTHAWPIHHLYNGKFPYAGRVSTLHAVKEARHFTQSAGLIAAHPVLDALSEEYPFVAWFLRAQAFEKFGYDPDGVFGPGPVDEYGFGPGTSCVVAARLSRP